MGSVTVARLFQMSPHLRREKPVGALLVTGQIDHNVTRYSNWFIQKLLLEYTVMLRRLFESAGSFLQALIVIQLLAAAAVAASALLFCSAMACYRVCQSAWVHLFSKPFP